MCCLRAQALRERKAPRSSVALTAADSLSHRSRAGSRVVLQSPGPRLRNGYMASLEQFVSFSWDIVARSRYVFYYSLWPEVEGMESVDSSCPSSRVRRTLGAGISQTSGQQLRAPSALERSQVQFPVSTCLTPMKLSSRGSDTSGLCGHWAYVYTGMQANCSHS